MNLLQLPADKGLIVFDGLCVLCNRAVSLLILIDKKKRLLFTTFDSETWKNISGYIPDDSNSIVYFNQGRHYLQSDAVIHIIKALGFPWNLALVIKLIPFAFREKLYRFVAANRYRIFGRKDYCSIPSPAIKKRYLA